MFLSLLRCNQFENMYVYIYICFVFNDLFENPTTFSVVNFLYLVVTIMKVVICITPGTKGCQTAVFHIL